jgi:hypothetical protein
MRTLTVSGMMLGPVLTPLPLREGLGEGRGNELDAESMIGFDQRRRIGGRTGRSLFVVRPTLP